jgi:serine/threonine protein kinase
VLEVVGETLEPGAVIANAYRLEHVLGRGGMGVVWAARELSGGRAVALKFLLAGPSADRKTHERFLREARAAMAISHPHIARVEAIVETDTGVPFMVMELLEGEPMRHFLRRRGTLNAFETAELLLPVVDAVAAAHAARIVHRDLKPENVFLVGGRDVRVLDFGIAKRLPKHDETASASLTSTGAFLGTPVYMAPEQIFGDEDIDARVDVWALGIIIYECLVGRRPTEGDGFGQIIKRITTDTLVPLERARAGLPKSLTRIVSRMLAKRRGDRPPLSEVREVLASIVSAGETATLPDEPPAVTLRLPPGATPPSPTATTQALPPLTPRGPTPTPPSPRVVTPASYGSAQSATPTPAPKEKEKTKIFPFAVAVVVTIIATSAFIELGYQFYVYMNTPIKQPKPAVSIRPIKIDFDAGTGGTSTRRGE